MVQSFPLTQLIMKNLSLKAIFNVHIQYLGTSYLANCHNGDNIVGGVNKGNILQCFGYIVRVKGGLRIQCNLPFTSKETHAR